VTTATPDQVIELMTDFSPNRPHRWPASSVNAPRRIIRNNIDTAP
jgi:hypothetical protein